MEYLVNIGFAPLAGLPEAEFAQVVAAEHLRAAELTVAGSLVRIWRVPCQNENWGLWSVADVTKLHRIITGLPAYRWMNEIKVIPLATHPADPLQGGAPPVPHAMAGQSRQRKS